MCNLYGLDNLCADPPLTLEIHSAGKKCPIEYSSYCSLCKYDEKSHLLNTQFKENAIYTYLYISILHIHVFFLSLLILYSHESFGIWVKDIAGR